VRTRPRPPAAPVIMTVLPVKSRVYLRDIMTICERKIRRMKYQRRIEIEKKGYAVYMDRPS
jgi:hypothetical protein